MKTTVAVIGAIAVLLLVGMQPVAAESSQQPTHIDLPLIGQTLQCGDTTLTVTDGTFPTVIRYGTDANGGVHVIFESGVQRGRAVDEAGNAYVLTGGDWAAFNLDDGHDTTTDVEVVHFVRPGSGEHFEGHVVYHVTLVDGNPVVSFDALRGTCEA